jgi:hypothetical protein
MIERILLCLAFYLGSAVVALSAEGSVPGSIVGIVRDDRGQPVVDAMIFVARSQHRTEHDGHFRINNIEPGRHILAVRKEGTESLKVISLRSGQTLANVDITLNRLAEITGRVVNDEGEPMLGMEVLLVGAEYYRGMLRNTVRLRAVSDDQGEYHLKGVEAGTRWLVAARPFTRDQAAISSVPADADLRLPVPVTTYYPRSPSTTGAEQLALQPGEIRAAVDVRMMSSKNFCIEGQASPGTGSRKLRFSVEDATLNLGSHSGGRLISPRPMYPTTREGKFRVCDLGPGEYRFTVTTAGEGPPFLLGVANFAVTDDDLDDVVVGVLPLVSLKGEVTWYDVPPDQIIDMQVQVRLDPLYRARFFEEAGTIPTRIQSNVPGDFEFPALAVEENDINVVGLPKGVYVKDIMYGADSILDDSLRLGSQPANTPLRILLAHGGAELNVQIVDKDGEPTSSGNVFVIPEDALTPADVAARTVSGSVDQLGRYSPRTLAPGRYKVLAATESFSRHPVLIAKLLQACTAIDAIHLRAGSSKELTLTERALR